MSNSVAVDAVGDSVGSGDGIDDDSGAMRDHDFVIEA